MSKITMMVCDRCGASKPVDESTCMFDLRTPHEGWVRASGDRGLCPECAPGYDLLLARHKVELEDYFTEKSGAE